MLHSSAVFTCECLCHSTLEAREFAKYCLSFRGKRCHAWRVCLLCLHCFCLCRGPLLFCRLSLQEGSRFGQGVCSGNGLIQSFLLLLQFSWMPSQNLLHL